MHSKLIRLQTALLTLALLFTVLVPVSAYAEGEPPAAQGAANSETISDPNTFNAWVDTQAYNNATTGRIWADKTVEDEQITFSGDLKDQPAIAVPKEEGADFLVALSALSSHASTTTTDAKPLDVVLVLDASGSMGDPMGNGDNTRRIDALRKAVDAFIDSTAEKNKKIQDESKKIQLSIVKFANDSQIMQGLTVCEGDNVEILKNQVRRINPAGGTRADNGMERAQAALAPARKNAKKVVIFFTDGTPTYHSTDFTPWVASSAIATAKSLKDAGAEVYTVGIFNGAKPDADVTSRQTSDENKFMQAVSSNYPQAAYTDKSDKWWYDDYEWDFGNRPANTNYYLAASSANGLNEVFNSIFKSITKNLAGPTEVGDDGPTKSGYVTFYDPLGDYMEVKDFEAIAFADHVYKNTKTTSTDENGKTVDTYTFTEQYTGTVSNAYPGEADLKDIRITVTRGSGSDGDTVQVQIPASMLPLRSYQVTTDNTGKPTLAVTNTQPISVIYSVGLKDDARNQITSGNITDATLANYVAANAKNGEISFYSNKFDGSLKTADGKTIGQTTATFTPATSNSFYYHTEDTPLFTKDGNPVTTFETGKTYYYKLNYLYQNPDNHKETLSKTDMVPMRIDDKECIGKNADGQCYIKAGTKKVSLPSAIDSQLGDKDEKEGGNKTGTAKRRVDFQWNLDKSSGVLYLGNNGKLTMGATGSVKVTKKVEADVGLTPDANTDFTMKFALAGTGVDDNAAYTYTVTNKDGAVQSTSQIQNNGEFTLKDGETAEIKGLPVGSNYTITEPSLPNGYTNKSINNGTGKVTAGTAQEVTVTNTYNPEGITVDPDTDSYPFKAVKILKGRAWRNSDTFTFRLQAVDGAPLPAEATESTNGIRYTECTVNGPSQGAAAGTSVPITFGSVTFTKPGTYEYDITEIIPTDKIPGVSYDNSSYRVTVTITDDGSGQLEMTGHTITKDDETANSATFTNTYSAEPVQVTLTAHKTLG